MMEGQIFLFTAFTDENDLQPRCRVCCTLAFKGTALENGEQARENIWNVHLENEATVIK